MFYYDDVNDEILQNVPRVVFSDSLFREEESNSGYIKNSIELKLENTIFYSTVVGINLPITVFDFPVISGLSPEIEVISDTKAIFRLNGQASNSNQDLTMQHFEFTEVFNSMVTIPVGIDERSKKFGIDFIASPCDYEAEIVSGEENILYITSVGIDGVTYNSSFDDGYQDYTSTVFNVNAGDVVNISTSVNTCGFFKHWSVYIDENQDDIFTFSEKRLYVFDNSVCNLNNAELVIPSHLASGTYKMRVMLNNNYTECACGAFNYGEVEDYTLAVMNNDPIVACMEDNYLFNIKVYLEGADLELCGNGVDYCMDYRLLEMGVLPLEQPYNVAPYNYEGSESVPVFIQPIVDWVLVEVKTGTPQMSADDPETVVVERKAGLLNHEGYIVDPSDQTSPLGFCNLDSDTDYYISVRHRNHLDVISSIPYKPNLGTSIDFTYSVSSAYGPEQLNEIIYLGSGVYGMYSGDYNQDGVIQNSDYDVWEVEPALNNTYLPVDGTLDGVVQATDYDIWFLNKAKMGIAEIQQN